MTTTSNFHKMVCIPVMIILSIPGAELGGFRGLQSPQIILSSLTHLQARLAVAWHSNSCLWCVAKASYSKVMSENTQAVYSALLGLICLF